MFMCVQVHVEVKGQRYHSPQMLFTLAFLFCFQTESLTGVEHAT